MGESVTLTLPASVASEVPVLARSLLDHMHELLERNTDAQLSELERLQLEALVDMAQFTQVFSIAWLRSARSLQIAVNWIIPSSESS